jgi:ppGpp synthetase/RelA/SpoT-type nucleotidyltranferase
VEKSMDDLKDFYSQNIGKYRVAAEKIEGLINEILKNANIPVHRVNSRVKTLDSYLKKAGGKGYKDPKNEITDSIGLRIITYVLKDMETVSSAIEKEFNIVEKKDKSEELGSEKMGYRSIHYIAAINDKRKELPEYTACKDCVFEIQIRTILQHTWAEIEHDKNYKYSGVLPNEIKRNLNRLSVLLEIADNEFNTTSQEIDKYIENVKNEMENNNLASIELNSTSLREFIIDRYGKYNINFDSTTPKNEIELIREIKAFGITNLKEYDEIINRDYLEYRTANNLKSGILGFTRDILILKDAKKYFEKCYNGLWVGLSTESAKMFETLAPDVLSIMESHGIETWFTWN